MLKIEINKKGMKAYVKGSLTIFCPFNILGGLIEFEYDPDEEFALAYKWNDSWGIG